MSKIIETIIAKAILEELPNGDKTINNLNIKDSEGRVQLVAQKDLTLSGCNFFEACIKYFNENNEVRWHLSQGENVIKGQKVATIVGDLEAIIKSDQIARNYLNHFSSIATYTSSYTSKFKDSDLKIFSTRNGTPGLLNFEKQAVSHGGGENGLANLSESIFIRECHLLLNNKPEDLMAKLANDSTSSIHWLAKSFDEAQLAFQYNVDHLLLSPMDLSEIEVILKEKPSQSKIGIVGALDFEQINNFSELGIKNFHLTHLMTSAPGVELELFYNWKRDTWK